MSDPKAARPHAALAAAVFASVLGVGPHAGAHVTVTPAETDAGVVQRYTLTVPSEKAIPTTRVEIEFPAELHVTDVAATAGWRVTAHRGKTGRIIAAVWSGGTIPPQQSAELTITARNPQSAATLAWKAIQTYQDGSEVHWIGPPTAQFPAAVSSVRSIRGPVVLVAAAAVAAAIAAGALALPWRRWRRRV